MPVNHNKVYMSSNTGFAPPPLDRRSDRLWNHTRGCHNKVVYDDFNEYAFGLEYKGAPTTPFSRQLGQFAGPLKRQLSGSKRSNCVSSNSNSYSKKFRSGIPLVETGYDISSCSCSSLEDGSRISEVDSFSYSSWGWWHIHGWWGKWRINRLCEVLRSSFVVFSVWFTLSSERESNWTNV